MKSMNQQFNTADKIRSRFPSLADGTIYFDNPGGTQVPLQVIWRITEYLQQSNANHGGFFPTSVRSDSILKEAHQAMAELLGASSSSEIIFGANMTTLTFALSRSLAQRLKPGDEIVVTRLDHDANIAPWLFLAGDTGAAIQWIDIDEEDCTLQHTDLKSKINSKTKIVAVGMASNAVGTVNPVREIADLAHKVGAWVFVDAVQYAPHAPIDVQHLGADFLVCSAYKFFGPHIGILYGRKEFLEQLKAYKVRPADDQPPGKWETGTLNHEGIAGLLGTIEYLEWLGTTMGWTDTDKTRRVKLRDCLMGIHDYEQHLTAYLLDQLHRVPELKIWGIRQLERLDERVPTVSFTCKGKNAHTLAKGLGKSGINVWSGHYYAVELMKRLGLLGKGGMVRVGLAHYNTREEIDRLLEVLKSMIRQG